MGHEQTISLEGRMLTLVATGVLGGSLRDKVSNHLQGF